MSASRRARRPKARARWSAKRKIDLVMQLLRGERTAAEAAHTHGLLLSEVELWRDQFLAAGERELLDPPTSAELRQQERERARLHAQLHELSAEVEVLQTAFKVLGLQAPPLPDRDASE